MNALRELEDENAWYCPGCKAHVCGTKRLQVWRAPDVLVLQLKRFALRSGAYGRMKLHGLVDCPVEGLDLSGICLAPDEDGCVYDLQAVSNHLGSAYGGHYTACARTADGWYHFDDDYVRHVTDSSIVTDAAYVLLYVRRRKPPVGGE